MRQPRKAPAKYLEGAPPYLLAIYDQGEKVGDRYTALFGWPLWNEKHPHTIQYLGFNAVPTSPNMGISMWGELKTHSDRTGLGKLIAWVDLPEDLQRHIIVRANEGEPIRMVWLERTGRTIDGTDYFGWWLTDGKSEARADEVFSTKAKALDYAKQNLIIVVPAPATPADGADHA